MVFFFSSFPFAFVLGLYLGYSLVTARKALVVIPATLAEEDTVETLVLNATDVGKWGILLVLALRQATTTAEGSMEEEDIPPLEDNSGLGTFICC